MTLIPLDRRVTFVAPVEGSSPQPYELNTVCAHPFCDEPATDDHHLWRRQGVSQAFWVLADLVDLGWRCLPNRVGLCRRHHDEVSGGVGGHKAWIRWLEPENQFGWLERTYLPEDTDWDMIGYLDPHPPLDERLHPSKLPASEPLVERASSDGGSATPDGAVLPSSSDAPPARTVCQSCGRKLPNKDRKEPRRQKRTFAIAVPKDHQENGLEVIESLLEPIAEKLGRKEHASWKYFTLVEALVFVNQHLHEVEGSVES